MPIIQTNTEQPIDTLKLVGLDSGVQRVLLEDGANYRLELASCEDLYGGVYGGEVGWGGAVGEGLVGGGEVGLSVGLVGGHLDDAQGDCEEDV